MKALLIYPKYPDTTFWGFKYALPFIRRKAAFPPLGLLTVAAMLPEGWTLKLVDLNVMQLTDAHIEWSDIVLISAMLVQKESAQQIINLAKSKGKTVVAGGPAFMASHEKFSGVDHFVLNEAEITLPFFLHDLQAGEAKRVYKSDKRPDIKTTPIPLWRLIKLKDYATMAIQYSRGCPYNCEFCDIIIMNGRIQRTKTPEQIVKELQALYDAGWRESVFIVDDNFIGNNKKVKKMLPEIIKWQKKHGYKFRLFTEASMNLASDEELLGLMSQANFNKVFLGIETPNVESLKECGKVQNINIDMAEAVRKINNYGIQVMGGFIVGFDSDTENIFNSLVEFIQSAGIVTAMVGMLEALPETRLWKRLKAEGRLLQDTTGENTDGTLNFIPKMDMNKLINGYKMVVAKIYSRKTFYQRIETFIKDFTPRAKTRLTRAEFDAFIRSFWRIGLFSRSSPYYIMLIIKTMITKAKALPTAIELAIYGEHFQKIAKKFNNKNLRQSGF